ncbi:MAG: polysaccharide pyruvyl transferase family protein [Pseudohongiellaceae bacterium]
MKVIYYQDPRGNFGDELNRWLWPKVFGDAITGFGHHGKETRAEYATEDLLFYGIGTILDDRIPLQPEKIIFGSGFGYGDKLQKLDNARVFFVRGSRTAKVLGLGPDKALTDPAILLRRFFPLVMESDKQHDISFMPHHSSVSGNYWRKACDELGIHYIDPRETDIEMVIREISGSRLVIAEAMHGAIVADTFRVPWIAVSSVAETNNFKWQDWCGTLGLSYAPVRFTPIFPDAGNRPWKKWLNAIKQMMRKRQMASVVKSRYMGRLSEDSLLEAHREEMDRRVQELQDYLKERGRA